MSLMFVGSKVLYSSTSICAIFPRTPELSRIALFVDVALSIRNSGFLRSAEFLAA